MNYLFFIISVLPVIAGLKLYDLFRSSYECTTGAKRLHYEVLWHATGFWTMWIAIIANALLWIPFHVIITNILWVAALGWFIMNTVWNLYHGAAWLYPGNGEGNLLESWTYNIAKWVHIPFKWVKIGINLLLFVAGIIIAICF